MLNNEEIKDIARSPMNSDIDILLNHALESLEKIKSQQRAIRREKDKVKKARKKIEELKKVCNYLEREAKQYEQALTQVESLTDEECVEQYNEAVGK